MRKLSLVLALATSLACLVAVCSVAATTPAGAKLTIQSSPEGVFGYVSSASKSCAENRKVVVFDQRGDQRDPDSDPKLGNSRATLDEGAYRWQVNTDDPGRYYAQAVAKQGCAAALSGSVEATEVGAAAGSDFPTCSPYTAEGPSEVCFLPQLHYDLLAVGVEACKFQKDSYSCEGYVSGPFPWGNGPSGGNSWTFFNWGGSNPRSVVIISQVAKNQEPFLTRMECHLTGPGSDRLMVDRAIVRTDAGTTEFYTPNLPGQAAGEPGGPLHLNFQNGRGLGADAWIEGYLYVKR